MFDDFMNHTCNIYHLADGKVKVGYGIEAADVKAAEPEPSEKAIPCHFHIRANNGVQLRQSEPYSSAEGDLKLSLPAGTDIRINDTVEDCRDGLKYRAGVPREVHGGHHIIVTLSRMKGVGRAL